MRPWEWPQTDTMTDRQTDANSFTPLHRMATADYSYEQWRLWLREICLHVCPSIKRVHCDKTKESSAQMFIPQERSFSVVFWEEEWLVVATPSTWNFGSSWHRWSEIADLQSILARSTSTLAPSKKVQLILIGNPLRAFSEPNINIVRWP